MRHKSIGLLALFSFLAAVVFAQTPRSDATYTIPIVWETPVNVPLGTSITYNLYMVRAPAAGMASATRPILTGIRGIDTLVSGLSAGTYCFTVTAVANGKESAQAMPFACVTVPTQAKAPQPPTMVVIGTPSSP